MVYGSWETDFGTHLQFLAGTHRPTNGEPVEKPRRITNWAGFCVAATSVTSDSKRLAFLEWRGHSSVYVAELQAGRTRITTRTRLTLDEGWNSPSGWTADSKAVLFFSGRNGAVALFKQCLGQDTAEPIITVRKEDEGLVGAVCLNPEGSSVFYMVRPNEGGPLATIQTHEGSDSWRISAAGVDGQLVRGRTNLRQVSSNFVCNR